MDIELGQPGEPDKVGEICSVTYPLTPTPPANWLTHLSRAFDVPGRLPPGAQRPSPQPDPARIIVIYDPSLTDPATIWSAVNEVVGEANKVT